jgi:hypothetical protein
LAVARQRRRQARPLERQAYFYRVVPRDDGGWRPRDVLRALDALPLADRYVDVGEGAVLLPLVDQTPAREGEFGHLRFLRVRRDNLPAVERAGSLSDLPIDEDAGLAEPTHILFGPGDIVAAEYNHFGPRISALGTYLRRKLERRVDFATYVQAEVLAQLDRLGDIRLVELTAQPSETYRQALAGDLVWGAIEQAGRIEETKAVGVHLTANAGSQDFTARAKESIRRILGAGADEAASVFKVRGFDPASGRAEVIDLLAPKVVRRLLVARVPGRSRALDDDAAYRALHEALESAGADLRNAGTLA